MTSPNRFYGRLLLEKAAVEVHCSASILGRPRTTALLSFALLVIPVMVALCLVRRKVAELGIAAHGPWFPSYIGWQAESAFGILGFGEKRRSKPSLGLFFFSVISLPPSD